MISPEVEALLSSLSPRPERALQQVTRALSGRRAQQTSVQTRMASGVLTRREGKLLLDQLAADIVELENARRALGVDD